MQLYSTQFEVSLFLLSVWKSLQNGAKVVLVPLLLISKIMFAILGLLGSYHSFQFLRKVRALSIFLCK